MENPFNSLTEASVTRPKTTIAVILVLTIALASMAQFINFDNSEDAFYPQNDTTELLYEIEDRYQASLDFIRIIDEIEQDDMKTEAVWKQFALIEANLTTDETFLPYHEPLFGGKATSGPAGSALFWINTQDPVTTQEWRDSLSAQLTNATLADEDNFTAALEDLSTAIAMIPSPRGPTAQELIDWQPGEVNSWLQRMDDNMSISEELGALQGQIQGLISTRTSPSEIGPVAAITGPLQGTIGTCLLYTSPSPRDKRQSRMPSSA